MNTNLIDKLKKYLPSVPIRRAWLFGSFSRGEEDMDSDVDLLVEFMPHSKIGMSYFRMLNDLEDLCHRKVDLVESDMLDPHVAQFVDNDKILIYERAY